MCLWLIKFSKNLYQLKEGAVIPNLFFSDLCFLLHLIIQSKCTYLPTYLPTYAVHKILNASKLGRYLGTV